MTTRLNLSRWLRVLGGVSFLLAGASFLVGSRIRLSVGPPVTPGEISAPVLEAAVRRLAA